MFLSKLFALLLLFFPALGHKPAHLFITQGHRKAISGLLNPFRQLTHQLFKGLQMDGDFGLGQWAT